MSSKAGDCVPGLAVPGRHAANYRGVRQPPTHGVWSLPRDKLLRQMMGRLKQAWAAHTATAGGSAPALPLAA
jgi:hypothetical protein